MPGAVMIGLQSVSKNFADSEVIRDFSLDIYQGEFVTLLGASGSGKTTILRMIAGFEDVSSGLITIDGVDMTGVPANLRPVNSVFQNYALFPHLNVFDNVAFGLRIKKVGEDAIRQRVRDALSMVGLENFSTRRIRQLSGGQQQRVAIARAIINRPKVLLLDEPLSALDLKLRKEMQLELKRLHRELGITFVYVTHDQEEAMSMSDRIGVLAHGKLLQYASPEELYANPASAAVASFVGETNLVEGVLADIGNGNAVVQTPHFITKVAEANTHSTGSSVVLSIRPEAIRVAKFDGSPICRGRITERIFAGSQIRLWVRVNAELTMQCLVHSTRNDEFSIGEEVDLHWESNRCLIFSQSNAETPGDLLGLNGSDGP